MRTRFLRSVIIVGIALAPWALAQSQQSATGIAALKARFDQIRAMNSKLTPNHRVMASTLAHQLRAAAMFDKLTAAAASGKSLKHAQPGQVMADANQIGVVSVNDNSTDLDFGSYDGVTQSTSSTAMCGSQVVVGFNDFGSFMQTFTSTFDPNTQSAGPLSQTGAAVSSDGGKTFHDVGTINPGSDPSNFLVSDPVLTCSDPNTFYYTQVFTHGGFSFFHFFNSIAISKSTDGGNTWADPVAAVDKDSFSHIIDKPWSAIDPSNPQRIYVTYTDFDFSFASPTCGFQTRTAIEMVMSSDGAQSFGNPIVIDEVCGDDSAVQASHVAFNSRGVAYVAWERMGLNVTAFVDSNGNLVTFPAGAAQVRITQVAADGTVAPSVLVDKKVFGGDTFAVERGALGLDFETDLQGQFRDLFGLDLAVDHSRGPNDGTVYVTWDDARNKSVPDLAGFQVDWTNPPGFIQALLQQFPNAQINLPFTPLLVTAGNYGYTDVLVSRSRDGMHFAPTMQVNSDRQPRVGGHDHFQPALAVDTTGRVAICWYDRRNDPRNLNIERFCAESKSGSDWGNFRVPISPFAPIHRLDFELFGFGFNNVDQSYMGDYDGLTSDFTGKTKGFMGAFQWMSSGMNPDVKSYRFE